MNTIKKLRKESGLKQQDLAEKLSISRSTVAMWETGKAQPDNETLLKLSSIFNSSIDYILNNDCFSPPASFGERLKELRKEHKLSQEDLGEILYLSKGAVGNWELGTRQPDYDTLKFLAEYFNVSTDYLLGIETLPAPQLSENEQYLIDKFRKLPWKSQNHILQTADILSEK